MNHRQPPLMLSLLLAFLLALAAFSAARESQGRRVTPTPWATPVFQVSTPTLTPTPGWWEGIE